MTRILLAGASGVIGRRLAPMLVRDGYAVTGTTRSSTKTGKLEAAGLSPVVVDVFDAPATARVVETVRPDIIIHQLTDLPDVVDPARMPAHLERNARLRIEGTRNLLAAAPKAGVTRVIAQSIAFVYAPGPEPYDESDPLDLDAEEPRRRTARAVAALEAAVLNVAGAVGIVLRYGQLYGPDTWAATPGGRGSLHVDAAAQAAFLAVTRGEAGIYNIAEDDGGLRIDKARAQLGFDPAFRISRS